jgi:hypothetical protein
MATMIKRKPGRSADLELDSPPFKVPDDEQTRQSSPTRVVRREVEPLERAIRAREAPESGLRSPPEAPDAGTGKGGVLVDDHKFRHGRSRG